MINNEVKEGTRRSLDTMPFDWNGCHATGEEVFHHGEWWNVYLDEDDNEVLGR